MFVSRFLDFQKTKYARFMNHRVPANKRYQPTEYEHAANCATHAFWIIPSILGSSNLYFLSDDDWETISAWIYGFGLCGLFVVSTIFHIISWKKRHLRMVEHCLHMFDRMVIYFFIAASYAPWLNLRELGPWASHMRWIVWIMASVGTIYVFFFHERPPEYSRAKRQRTQPDLWRRLDIQSPSRLWVHGFQVQQEDDGD
ncbi:monocyte to macrophage differentiation factor 2 isoform X4 [Sarcophilus harrisii]|uniref:monocyte to macrophage differentiation factor 2 isoform X4 n=1 Tax=Sarcophilus harrisii TaxID=9305 RepID=UPI001301AD53|nr:monocyte to macrophage differentiation factor 2 isoform X4 [Sarcophilus harrisii]